MTVKIINRKEKALNRHWKNFVDKEYLGSHNLEPGEEMLLTIEKFVGEEMVVKVGSKKDEKVPKQVLYFKENVPKMIMNITNGNTIAMLYGTHPDQWAGKQILVYATPVSAFGKTQDALRVRDSKPKSNADFSGFIRTLEEKATDLESLRATFKALPVSAQTNEDVVKAKDILKARIESKNDENN